MAQNKYHFVYKTTHSATGRFYIGKHSSLVDPKIEFDGYYGSGTVISRMLEVYPLSEFERLVLKEFETPELAFEYEKEIVAKYLNDPNCLNISSGGRIGGFFAPSYLTEENLKVRNTAIKDAYKNPEVRKRVSQGVIKVLSDPIVRKRISDNTIKALSDPDVKRRQVENTAKALNNPEVGKRQVEGIRKAWSGISEKLKNSELVAKYANKVPSQDLNMIKRYEISKQGIERLKSQGREHTNYYKERYRTFMFYENKMKERGFL
jgi:hypothetical protein